MVAARSFGIPESIMRGLTLTETGRTIQGSLRPWPWAINQAGSGQWFSTPEEMLDRAGQLIQQGETNFDIGCFQLNYRWHAEQFASLEDMVDPGQNAQYAARYLYEKYDEKGSWEGAVAAYHSSTPAYANRYLARFMTIHAGLATPTVTQQPVTQQPVTQQRVTQQRVARRQDEASNMFPFLTVGVSGSGASLVPRVEGGPRLIGGDQ